jgi:hypothetical protein
MKLERFIKECTVYGTVLEVDESEKWLMFR